MTQLKPCPRCNSYQTTLMDTQSCWFYCDECNHATTPKMTEKEAIEDWNEEPRMLERIEKLEAQTKRLTRELEHLRVMR